MLTDLHRNSSLSNLPSQGCWTDVKFWLLMKAICNVCVWLKWVFILQVGGFLAQPVERHIWSLGFDSRCLRCEFDPVLALPRCKWVPLLLEKFPATDWCPVLGMVRASCQQNVTEIGDRLWPYEPYGSKRQTFLDQHLRRKDTKTSFQIEAVSFKKWKLGETVICGVNFLRLWPFFYSIFLSFLE